jgi:hypothetical protein
MIVNEVRKDYRLEPYPLAIKYRDLYKQARYTITEIESVYNTLTVLQHQENRKLLKAIRIKAKERYNK